jgi:hypothetical protein
MRGGSLALFRFFVTTTCGGFGAQFRLGMLTLTCEMVTPNARSFLGRTSKKTLNRVRRIWNADHRVPEARTGQLASL